MKNIQLIILIITANLYGQPGIEWQKSIGGSGYDQYSCMIQTPDDGFLLAGHTISNDGDISGNHGSVDASIVKLSSSGAIEWQKCYGGTNADGAYKVIPATDGGYVFIATNTSQNGDFISMYPGANAWIVKIDTTGNIVWQFSLSGSGSEYPRSIYPVTDGGYVIAGDSDSVDGDFAGNSYNRDIWVIKLTSSGVLEWHKTFGVPETDEAKSIIQTSDGGFIFASSITATNNYTDIWVVKLSSSGILEWQSTFGGTLFDDPSIIKQSSDGGYIIGGISSSTDGDFTSNYGLSDCSLIKLSNLGAIEWLKNFGGTGSDGISALELTADGGFVLIGSSQSNDNDVSGHHGSLSNYDIWIAKLDSFADIEWQKSFGGTADDYGMAVLPLSDNDYIISCGLTWSSDFDIASNHGVTDGWVARLGYDLGLPLHAVNYFVITPNPFNQEIHIASESPPFSYTIFDASGRAILNGHSSNVNNLIDTSQLTTGTYIIKLDVDNSNDTSVRKIMKM